MTETIRFYDTDGPYGEATLTDDGEIEYSNDSVMHEMESSVRIKGVDWAWGRFSNQSNGKSWSNLVTD